jgi:phosphoribosylformimino-5-aminoimidazole carboxamide ribotide isomerase
VRILGVIDLAGGRAVHARAGRREDYEPVQQVGRTTIEAGDALAVAAAYRQQFGIHELYVADLDALTTRCPQTDLVTALARDASIWLDAGVSSLDAARQSVACGATRVVVGLETLDSFDTLARIGTTIGREATVFSLDLHGGRPIHRPGTVMPGTPAATIGTSAARAGIDTMIVLDLARVGTGQGLDLRLMRELRHAVPAMALVAGGGIRSLEDVERLAAIGVDGAIVASALHDGRLTGADLERIRRIQPSVSR